MISLALLKQTIKANGVIWLAMAGVSALLLGQFASLEMTQNLLFVIYYSVMITLFPAIYSLISSNKLLTSQVDRGSMAYVLSTPKSRVSVVMTQIFYSFVSLLLMFVITTTIHVVINSIDPIGISLATGGAVAATGDLTAEMIILTNLSAFCASFAVSGLCFMFSGIFNLSRNTIGICGTLVGVCILAGLMGMFGSLGIDSLENFKYLTLFTLYDYQSVLLGVNDWISKAIAAGVIGVLGYMIGAVWFCKKDLPL